MQSREADWQADLYLTWTFWQAYRGGVMSPGTIRCPTDTAPGPFCSWRGQRQSPWYGKLVNGSPTPGVIPGHMVTGAANGHRGGLPGPSAGRRGRPVGAVRWRALGQEGPTGGSKITVSVLAMLAEHSEPVRMLAGVTHHNVTAHKTSLQDSKQARQQQQQPWLPTASMIPSTPRSATTWTGAVGYICVRLRPLARNG